MSKEIEIVITNEGLKCPEYKTSHSAAFDLVSACCDPIVLQPGKIEVIPTGLKIKIPEGFAGFISPRSGTSLSGFSVNNSPGIIDADFRKEMGIIAINNSDAPITIQPFERIAQLSIVPVLRAAFKVVPEFSPDTFENTRQGGFGSTGKSQ